MRESILILIFVLTQAIPAVAQRSLPAASDFTQYRPVGEFRVWTYEVSDSVLGQFVSTVKEDIKFNGQTALFIEQNFKLNYNKLGIDRNIVITSDHYVTHTGYYLGDKMSLTFNEQEENLELKYKNGVVDGFMTRVGSKVNQTRQLSQPLRALDSRFLDQVESFLAFHDITVGAEIVDSVFVSQTLLVDRVRAFVEDFRLITLYNQVRDSCFVIQFTQPKEMLVYFTPDKRLVKVDIPDQETKIYLDIVRKLPSSSITKPAFTYTKLISLLPLYGIYFIAGFLALVFFAAAHLKWMRLYLAVGVGALGFVVSSFTQVPLQTYLVEQAYLPQVNAGGSSYFWAIVPAIPAAVIQETLKLVAIILLARVFNQHGKRLLVIGAAVGSGFGIIEAAYIVSQLPAFEIISINLIERSFQIFLHISTGVILARLIIINSNSARITLFLIAVLANAWLKYLPVFVYQNVVDVGLLYILQPLVPVIVLTYSIYLMKKSSA